MENDVPLSQRICYHVPGWGKWCFSVKLYFKQSKELSASHESHPKRAEKGTCRLTAFPLFRLCCHLSFSFLNTFCCLFCIICIEALHPTEKNRNKRTQTKQQTAFSLSLSQSLLCTHTSFLHTFLCFSIARAS